MRVMSRVLPGIERIRARFIDLLGVRLVEIDALCTDETDPRDMADRLKGAQTILHQIAGTAGTLGYTDFGDCARRCEEMIIAHLDGGRPRLDAILRELGSFAETAEDLMRTRMAG